jgi:hypothetical protein
VHPLFHTLLHSLAQKIKKKIENRHTFSSNSPPLFHALLPCASWLFTTVFATASLLLLLFIPSLPKCLPYSTHYSRALLDSNSLAPTLEPPLYLTADKKKSTSLVVIYMHNIYIYTHTLEPPLYLTADKKKAFR